MISKIIYNSCQLKGEGMINYTRQTNDTLKVYITDIAGYDIGTESRGMAWH